MYIKRFAEKSIKALLNDKKIIILLGARQVGKTTLIEPIVKEKNGLLLNCDIDVDKAKLMAISSLSPTEALIALGEPKLLAIDEAQNLPEIGRIVKGWYDAKIKTKIILLGSSSLDLLDKTAEPLTGRNEKIFLPPLLFEEIVTNQDWYLPQIKPSQQNEKFTKQLSSLLLSQIVYGSYPETITTHDKEKYLLNLASDYLLRDILQSGLIKSPNTVKRLLTLLAFQTGSEVSINELASNLQISRLTVEKYIDLLERSYVLFRVPAFSTNQRKEIAKNSKIFFWDTGVRNALLKEFSFSPTRSDIGSLFENCVISEFAKQNLLTGNKNNIYFWRKRDGSEVDLVVKGTNVFKAYEIKWTKQNKTSSIKSFSNIYNIPVEVITRDTIFDILLNDLSL